MSTYDFTEEWKKYWNERLAEFKVNDTKRVIDHFGLKEFVEDIQDGIEKTARLPLKRKLSSIDDQSPLEDGELPPSESESLSTISVSSSIFSPLSEKNCSDSYTNENSHSSRSHNHSSQSKTWSSVSTSRDSYSHSHQSNKKTVNEGFHRKAFYQIYDAAGSYTCTSSKKKNSTWNRLFKCSEESSSKAASDLSEILSPSTVSSGIFQSPVDCDKPCSTEMRKIDHCEEITSDWDIGPLRGVVDKTNVKQVKRKKSARKSNKDYDYDSITSDLDSEDSHKSKKKRTKKTINGRIDKKRIYQIVSVHKPVNSNRRIIPKPRTGNSGLNVRNKTTARDDKKSTYQITHNLSSEGSCDMVLESDTNETNTLRNESIAPKKPAPQIPKTIMDIYNAAKRIYNSTYNKEQTNINPSTEDLKLISKEILKILILNKINVNTVRSTQLEDLVLEYIKEIVSLEKEYPSLDIDRILSNGDNSKTNPKIVNGLKRHGDERDKDNGYSSTETEMRAVC